MTNIIATILSILLVNTTASAQDVGGIADLLRANVEGPVVVMDLVKFKPGGEEKYAIYDGIVEEKLKSLGGAVVFRGTARKVDATKLNGTEPVPHLHTLGAVDHTSWDRVTFRKYPSMQAVMDMAGSTEGALPNRLASVDASFVYAFSGEMPSPPPRNFPMPVLSPPPSADTVYILNLLRFAGDAGREQYFTKYGPPASTGVKKRGGATVYVLKGVGPVISDEEIDRLLLVSYPSIETFLEMIASDEYQAIAHFRTDAIELGPLFPFSYAQPKE